MSYSEEIGIESLVGEVLSSIDTDECNSVIMLTTKSGRIIKIHHMQDCCEHVRIEDTKGNWHDLIGKVIVGVECDVTSDGRPANAEGWTQTTLTFKADDATVVSRWIGESNGYYSESVDIQELTKH